MCVCVCVVGIKWLPLSLYIYFHLIFVLGSTPQNSSCTDTYHPSQKLSKLDKPDMQDTVQEVGMSS